MRDVVAAAAFANARTFGGEDYVGFHTMMAIAPAYHMSMELPEAKKALPLLKILYRNASRIQEFGGVRREVLDDAETLLEAALRMEPDYVELRRDYACVLVDRHKHEIGRAHV